MGLGDPTGRLSRLYVLPAFDWVIRSEGDDLPDHMFVDPPLEGGTQDPFALDLREPVERRQFLGQNIGLAANDAVRFAVESIELEIDVRAYAGQLSKKPVVRCDPFAVRVELHVGEAALRGGLHLGINLRMDG